jgi:hypothetical protein
MIAEVSLTSSLGGWLLVGNCVSGINITTALDAFK